MKWFRMKGPGGTITCKGNYAGEAIREASERWACDPETIEIIREDPYYGSGERIPVSEEARW